MRSSVLPLHSIATTARTLLQPLRYSRALGGEEESEVKTNPAHRLPNPVGISPAPPRPKHLPSGKELHSRATVDRSTRVT